MARREERVRWFVFNSYNQYNTEYERSKTQLNKLKKKNIYVKILQIKLFKFFFSQIHAVYQIV